MVTLTEPISSGMVFRTGISRFSSGRTIAVSAPCESSRPTPDISPAVFRAAISWSMDGICFVWPTDDGMLIKWIFGVLPTHESSPVSNEKACGKSRTLRDMNIDARFSGSFSIDEEKSQQNSAIPASRILRMAVFSHSFSALSPTKTNFSACGKASFRISAALSVLSLSAKSR